MTTQFGHDNPIRSCMQLCGCCIDQLTVRALTVGATIYSWHLGQDHFINRKCLSSYVRKPVLLLALVTCRIAHIQIHADVEHCVQCRLNCGCMYTAINSSTASGALSFYVEASGLCNHTVISTAVVVWISCTTCCNGWTVGTGFMLSRGSGAKHRSASL